MHDPSPGPRSSPPLPLAVQIGFAGSRRLFDVPDPDGALERAAGQALLGVLAALPAELGLDAQHFPVGIAQTAAGADLLFGEALQALGWPQRVFLPQPRDDYLAAGSAHGPDFSDDERRRALAVLGSAHVIEERVVATANDRAGRFEEVNLQIVDEADLLLCLRRAGAADRPGGTADLIARAKARGRAVLELVCEVDAGTAGALRLHPVWHGRAGFEPPAWPAALHTVAPPLTRAADGAPPTAAACAHALKAHASGHARRRRSGFERAAGVILATHLMATVIGAVSLKVPATALYAPLLLSLVAFELALLLYGLWTHHALEHDDDAHGWALARLAAELARSVQAQAGLPFGLGLLPGLPFPRVLRPVLRTLRVLQLRDARAAAAGTAVADVSALRDAYLKRRLRDAPGGQVPYYARERRHAGRRLRNAGRAFLAMSIAAVLFVAGKGLLKALGVSGADGFVGLAGIAAVVLPVCAAAAMSLAAALDWRARASTFQEAHDELTRLAAQIEGATSLRELQRLVAQTESRLLGETLVWYTRRAHTHVA